MGENSAIGWTDHTFNPWWGCSRVSAACQNCYAETFAKRTGHNVWGNKNGRRELSDSHWRQPLKWNNAAAKAGQPAFVFCASMADVFEDRPELDQPRQRLWELIAATPWLTWQLLTKRPQNICDMVPQAWVGEVWWGMRPAWPRNVWIGTTIEDQTAMDERIVPLLMLPAPRRFLSMEPLLGPVDMGQALSGARPPFFQTASWVIVGGESGPGHRPLNLEHATNVVEQCETAGVPVWFKQVGGRTPTAGGDRLNARLIQQRPEPHRPEANQ